jgi:hypothetical protein
MKTFQEALDTISATADRDDPASVREAMEKCVTIALKYKDLSMEAFHDADFRSIVEDIVDRFDSEEGCDVVTAAMNAAILGLQIGMEMEKCSQCHQEVIAK